LRTFDDGFTRSSLKISNGFDWSTGLLSETKDILGTGLENSLDIPSIGSRERKIRARVEVDHTLELQTGGPQSNADFERILLGSPNSSYAWIRYASFHIQLSDIVHAREVLRRALKTIHFREEQERFNIWMSLLNLECTFGDDSTVELVFQEALKANDPKTIYLRLASIYQQAGVSKVQSTCS
jgi:rRNA biogenesis protein RRP5